MKRIALLALITASTAAAQIPNGSQPVASKNPVKASTPAEALASVPNLNTLISNTTSELAPVLERYSADLASVNRRYDASDSPDQRRRMRDFYMSWRQRLTEIPFEKLKQEGRVDYVLLDNRLKYQLALLDRADKERAESAELVPFADKLLMLQDQRRDLIPNDPVASARTLTAIAKQIDSLRAKLEGGARGGGAAPSISKTVANRTADDVDQIRNVVGGWYRYYDGYDPLFTWWAKEPFTTLDAALTNYARAIRTRLVGLPAAGQQVAGAAGAAGGGRGNAGGGGGGGGRGNAGGGGAAASTGAAP